MSVRLARARAEEDMRGGLTNALIDISEKFFDINVRYYHEAQEKTEIHKEFEVAIPFELTYTVAGDSEGILHPAPKKVKIKRACIYEAELDSIEEGFPDIRLIAGAFGLEKVPIVGLVHGGKEWIYFLIPVDIPSALMYLHNPDLMARLLKEAVPTKLPEVLAGLAKKVRGLAPARVVISPGMTIDPYVKLLKIPINSRKVKRVSFLRIEIWGAATSHIDRVYFEAPVAHEEEPIQFYFDVMELSHYSSSLWNLLKILGEPPEEFHKKVLNINKTMLKAVTLIKVLTKLAST